MLTPAALSQAHPKFHADSTLYVITPISNPKRYESRYRLFHEFAKYVESFPNVVLIPVEMAFGERDYVIQHPNVVRVRGNHELWHKENLVNIAISRLPYDWKYLAVIDGDIKFTRDDWPIETLHLLQHYQVVQMFSHATDLGPDYQPVQQNEGLVYTYEKLAKMEKGLFDRHHGKGYSSYYGHPGFAWAWRREAVDGVGGMLDTAITGSADHNMALCMYGQAERSLPVENDHPYNAPIWAWQERALRVIKKNVGYLPGTIHHYWHGKKADRRYIERRAIIVNNNFDPAKDLVRDYQGLWQLSGNNIGLRDDLKRYFSARNEDSIDT